MVFRVFATDMDNLEQLSSETRVTITKATPSAVETAEIPDFTVSCEGGCRGENKVRRFLFVQMQK